MEKKRVLTIRRMTTIGILGAISIVLGLTPLGFIPVGPTNATIMHIPVIIGAIIEGPVVGGLVGLIFGLFSIFQAITRPTPVSYVFLNPLVSVLPRVLIGIVSYYVYNTLKNLGNKKTLGLLYVLWAGLLGYLLYGVYGNIVNSQSIWLLLTNIGLIILTILTGYFSIIKYKGDSLDIIIGTIVGTFTNTMGVLTMVYLFYGERFVLSLGQDPKLARNIIYGIGFTNGIPEVIIAIIITVSVVNALQARK